MGRAVGVGRCEGEEKLKEIREYKRGGRGSGKCTLEGPSQHIGQGGPFSSGISVCWGWRRAH